MQAGCLLAVCSYVLFYFVDITVHVYNNYVYNNYVYNYTVTAHVPYYHHNDDIHCHDF